MSPITHLLISWVVADAGNLDKKDRAIVTVAGLAPDSGPCLTFIPSPIWSGRGKANGSSMPGRTSRSPALCC